MGGRAARGNGTNKWSVEPITKRCRPAAVFVRACGRPAEVDQMESSPNSADSSNCKADSSNCRTVKFPVEIIATAPLSDSMPLADPALNRRPRVLKAAEPKSSVGNRDSLEGVNTTVRNRMIYFSDQINREVRKHLTTGVEIGNYLRAAHKELAGIGREGQ